MPDLLFVKPISHNDGIANLPLEYGMYFCNVESIENNSSLFSGYITNNDSCFINKALYKITGNDETIKTNGGFAIVSGVIDDGDSNPNMYLTSKK